jgi:hypothetical protein
MEKKKILYTVVIVTVIVIVSAIVIMNLSTPQNCSPPISRDTLTVTGSIDIDKNKIAHFTGVVQNNSCQTAHKVGVTVILYNRANDVIGNLNATVNPTDIESSSTATLNGTMPMSEIGGVIDHTGYDLTYARNSQHN